MFDLLVDNETMQGYGGPFAIDRWFWIDGLYRSLRHNAIMVILLGELNARLRTSRE